MNDKKEISMLIFHDMNDLKKKITSGATFEPEYCEHDNYYHIYCQVLHFLHNGGNDAVLINNQHNDNKDDNHNIHHCVCAILPKPLGWICFHANNLCVTLVKSGQNCENGSKV